MLRRVRELNDAPVHPRRAWVLYWMTSFRRARSNFALDRALWHAKTLGRPLVVLEALRVASPHASDRLHTFVLQGMADNAAAFADSPVHHYPYVEREAGEGAGLVEALARDACVVVGDDWPGFFIPRLHRAMAPRLPVRFEVVDSNGLFPMHDTPRVFSTAHSFRVHLQKTLPAHLATQPLEAPLRGLSLPTLEKLPRRLTGRWPRAGDEALRAAPSFLATLPIDHSVPPVALRGGSSAARDRARHFVTHALSAYHERRDEPEVDGTSRLSPALHFGHLSTHELFQLVLPAGWAPDRLGRSIGGARQGWWQVPAPTEAFLDQLVTWRELSFNMASHRPDDFTSFDALPPWALATMKAHQHDARPHLYTREEFERGLTHDPLWNAAMGQLRSEGWFHNHLRMLWGKKIYEWSPSGREALRTMDFLMSRYALDGRDPVSWSGALWVLARYDRAWGPGRPIFGTLRFMSSANLARKVRVKDYLQRFGTPG